MHNTLSPSRMQQLDKKESSRFFATTTRSLHQKSSPRPTTDLGVVCTGFLGR